AGGQPRPVEVKSMKIMALVLGSCALLALPINAAGAGQCASEIDSLSKMMTAQDAGSGPTPGAPGSTMGQHPPTTAMSQADTGGTASAAASRSNRPQLPPTAAMNRETTGMSTPESAQPRPEANPPGAAGEHPPTAAMTRETQGIATSPQDVQRQNQGQPTAAEIKSKIAETHSLANAMGELQRARFLDQQGKEAECLSALGHARLMMGP